MDQSHSPDVHIAPTRNAAGSPHWEHCRGREGECQSPVLAVSTASGYGTARSGQRAAAVLQRTVSPTSGPAVRGTKVRLDAPSAVLQDASIDSYAAAQSPFDRSAATNRDCQYKRVDSVSHPCSNSVRYCTRVRCQGPRWDAASEAEKRSPSSQIRASTVASVCSGIEES